MLVYTPPTSFKDLPFSDVRSFVAARALCTLIGVTPDGLINAHVPVLLAGSEEAPVLEGHVAATTAGFAGLDTPVSAIAVFQREQDYGLPEAARPAADDHAGGEPWGAVHLHGTLEMVRDHDFQMRNIEKLGENHLAARIHPWAAPDLPRAFTEVLAGKIAGLRFRIHRTQASHRYAAKGQGRTDGIVDIDPREFTSPNCRPRT